jgi:hypothetical protein
LKKRTGFDRSKEVIFKDDKNKPDVLLTTVPHLMNVNVLKSAKSMSLKKIKKNNNAGRKKCRY